jgi:outer membrane protein OmpA-like peptidoglycan-associated protein
LTTSGIFASGADASHPKGPNSFSASLRQQRNSAVSKLQGVAENSVSATSFGNSAPVTSNDNAAGRQENRRMELVVSGDAIGTPTNATTGSLQQ